MSSNIVSDAQKLEILYNKSFGVATSLPSGDLAALPPVNASAKIIPSLQIYSQEIPAIAPALSDLVQDATFYQTVNPSAEQTSKNALCKRFTSRTYPHIVKYENLQLTTEQFQQSFNGKVNGVNLLSQSIPYNYDPAGSYGIVVQVYTSAAFLDFAQGNKSMPWYYDKDAGFLTFYGSSTTTYLTKPPLITFWRYEGTFGLGSSGSGNGATGATGAVGPQGVKGDAGERGAAGAAGGGVTGIYANDTWLLSNLLGQPGGVRFGTPVSKATAIYIPWSYPSQSKVGWAVNQWLPNITNFTASVIPGPTGSTTSYPVVPNQTGTSWIKDNITNTTNYTTMLAIQKNPIIGNAYTSLSDTTTGVTGTYNAYKYYDLALSTALTNSPSNRLNAYYSNPGSDGPFGAFNINSLQFSGFLSGGAPTLPKNILRTSGTSSSIGVSWTAPDYADSVNQGEGTISSYDISYNTIGSLLRYGGPIVQTARANSATTSATLNNVYPDASYSISVLATNNSGLTGGYTGINNVYSGALSEPAALTTISVESNVSNLAYSTRSTIYKVSDSTATTSLQYPLYNGTKVSTSVFEAPIHRLANRGLLQGAAGATLMTLSAIFNGVTGPAINYQGFPATKPQDETATDGNVVISTNSVIDCYVGTAQDGFYLKAKNIQIDISQGPVVGFCAGNAVNTLTVTQTFNTGNGTTSTTSNPASFFYENTVPTTGTGSVPSCTIDSVTFSNTSNVSGLNILTSASTAAISSTASYMGTYFYRSPLVTYDCNKSSATKLETGLTNITSGLIGSLGSAGSKFDSTLTFGSSFPLALNTYSTSMTLGMVAKNIVNDSSKATKIYNNNILIDVPSFTLVNSLASSILPVTTGATPTVGYRILSGASVQNNCSGVPTAAQTTQYENTARLTIAPYDTELLIAEGLFVTPTGTSYYKDYSSYEGNNGVNYSTIPTTITVDSLTSPVYRFASFCWKLPASSAAFKKLSFTIDSIVSAALTGTNLLAIRGVQLPIFYAFRDTTKSADYNDTNYNASTFNTGWINANSNSNPVGSGNYFLYTSPNDNRYGNLGGITSDAVVLSNGGATATINAFIPAVNPVIVNTINLYLRIAVPMNVDIRFGKVSAKVSS